MNSKAVKAGTGVKRTRLNDLFEILYLLWLVMSALGSDIQVHRNRKAPPKVKRLSGRDQERECSNPKRQLAAQNLWYL